MTAYMQNKLFRHSGFLVKVYIDFDNFAHSTPKMTDRFNAMRTNEVMH